MSENESQSIWYPADVQMFDAIRLGKERVKALVDAGSVAEYEVKITFSFSTAFEGWRMVIDGRQIMEYYCLKRGETDWKKYNGVI